MSEVLRTVAQEFNADSSSGAYQGEQLDIGSIGGNIVAVTIIPTSGTLEIQGRSGDDWVEIPSSGVSLDINFDQLKTNRLPYLRSDSGGGTADLFFTVKVKD